MNDHLSTGFILSSQSRDRQGSTEIILWVKTSSSVERVIIKGERPVCFITTENYNSVSGYVLSSQLPIDFKALKLKTFDFKTVYACYSQTIAVHQQLQTLLQQHGLTTLESDFRLSERYLMERFIRGGICYQGTANKRAYTFDVFPKKVQRADFTPQFTRVSLDIECSEEGELYSIGLDSQMDSRVIMRGARQVDPHNDISFIEWVVDERTLLQRLESWFQEFDPDLIVGWNIIEFDFKVLVKRSKLLKHNLCLSRSKDSAYFREGQTGRQSFIHIPGRVVLDGISMMKAATYVFRSWSLENVAQELLGEGKKISATEDKLTEIKRQFLEDKPALAAYNLQDCILVNRIFEHTHLIDYLIQRTKLTGLELDKVGGSVAAFTNLYLPQLHRAGYIAPNLPTDHPIASPGGYVMSSKPGLYDSVLVLDFKSLYPSIIRTFCIDPLGLIEGIKLKKQAIDSSSLSIDQLPIEGFREAWFHRHRHFLPQMIEDLWHARDEAKKNQDAAVSQAIKIIMNSFYGVLGSNGCRFFDHRLASSITMRGHQIMKQTRQLIEEKGYEVIYGDTDSTFVSLNSSLPSSQADRIGKELSLLINQWWSDHLQQVYAVTSKLEIEYETHYRKFLMPTIRGQETGSKKRYAGLIIDKNKNESIIYKGLETARSDWTSLAQEFQQALYHRVFHEEDIDFFVREYVNKTLNGEFDDKLIYRKRLRRPLDTYVKNIPPHVKAARLEKREMESIGRQSQLRQGSVIAYVMTLQGPEPVTFQRSKLDYNHYIDKQLEPIANGILPFTGKDFNALTLPQLGLF